MKRTTMLDPVRPDAARCSGRLSARLATLALGAASTAVLAHEYRDHDEVEIPFEEAHVFFELNHTDGDLGIHGKVDGGPWAHIALIGPDDRWLMSVRASGRLWRQGVTELFFESAEPPFDELPPERFFRRFPEGVYEVEGWATNGDELESEVEITHSMPAPAEPTVNGQPLVEVCDEEDEAYDESLLVLAGPGVTIAWPAVTMSHPDLGTMPPVPVTIVNYEVVVEAEIELADGEEFTSVMSAVLPPDVTSMSVPDEFLAQSDRFKYEVLAREESDNQTAVESCFIVL